MLKIVPAIHPGEILREEFLAPLGMSAGALARRLNVPRTRIERVAAETHPITADTALRLSKFFDTTPEFWLGMQTSYDLAIEAAALADELAEIEALGPIAAWGESCPAPPQTIWQGRASPVARQPS